MTSDLPTRKEVNDLPVCPRCGGDGMAYGETPDDTCPYMDFTRRLWCQGGKLEPMWEGDDDQ